VRFTKCPKFGGAGTLPSRKTIRHSLSTIRQSPITTIDSGCWKGYSLYGEKKAFEEGDDHAQVVRFLGIDGFERDT
jgi:hypothetical protein